MVLKFQIILGVVNQLQGQNKETINYYQHILLIDLSVVNVYFNLADIYLKAKNMNNTVEKN